LPGCNGKFVKWSFALPKGGNELFRRWIQDKEQERKMRWRLNGGLWRGFWRLGFRLAAFGSLAVNVAMLAAEFERAT
jgi:hypothetical protein